VYRWYGLYAVSKHVEVLANGVVLFAFKLRSLDMARAMAAGTGATPVASGYGAAGFLANIPSLALEGGAAAVPASLAAAHTRMTSTMAASTTPMGGAGGAGSDSARITTDRRSVYTSGAADAPSLEARVADMVRDVALHFALPRTSITPLLDAGTLSAQEAAYAYCAWKVRG
jgi:hypothetical protein